MATDGWTFEWRRTWDEVWSPDFLAAWTALAESDPQAHVFARWEVVRAWADTCGSAAGAGACVGLAHNHGVRVLLPWVVTRQRGRLAERRTLEPAGGDLFGYQNPIVEGGASAVSDWSAFWRAARTSVAACCDQALFRFVEPAYVAGDDAEPNPEANPVLNLESYRSLDDLLDACSGNHRRDVRRRVRVLEGKGPLSLWCPGAADRAGAESDAERLFLPAHDRRWRSLEIRNTLFRPGWRGLVERVIGDGLAQGWAHYAALRVDGVSIAWHLGFFDRGRLYWWMPAHDPSWDAYSPGKVLLHALIGHAFERHWNRIHFQTGGHPYKLAWNAASSPLAVVRWHAPTVRGRVIAWYDARSATP